MSGYTPVFFFSIFSFLLHVLDAWACGWIWYLFCILIDCLHGLPLCRVYGYPIVSIHPSTMFPFSLLFGSQGIRIAFPSFACWRSLVNDRVGRHGLYCLGRQLSLLADFI